MKIDQEGFQYKKRQSRSKLFGQGAVNDQQNQVKKRVKLSSEVRESVGLKRCKVTLKLTKILLCCLKGKNRNVLVCRGLVGLQNQ